MSRTAVRVLWDMEVIEKTHYLAGGVHLGCVPIGLVLEVDLIPLELGLSFS